MNWTWLIKGPSALVGMLLFGVIMYPIYEFFYEFFRPKKKEAKCRRK